MSEYCYFCLAVTILAKRGGENLFAYPATWIVLASIAVLFFVYCKGRSSRDEEIKSLEESCSRKIKYKEEEVSKIIKSSREEIDSIRRSTNHEIAKTNEQWRIAKELLLGDTMRFATVDERIEKLMEKEDEALRKAVAQRAPVAAEQVKRLKEKNRKLQIDCLQLRTKVEFYEKLEPHLNVFMDCSYGEVQRSTKEKSERKIKELSVTKSRFDDVYEIVKERQQYITKLEAENEHYKNENENYKAENKNNKEKIQKLTLNVNHYKGLYEEIGKTLEEAENHRLDTEHRCNEAEQQRDKAIQQKKSTEQQWRKVKVIMFGDNMHFPTVDERIEKLMLSVDDAVCAELEARAPRAADEIRKVKAEKRALWRKNILLQTRINVYEAFAPWMDEYMDCTLEEILAAKEEFDRLEEMQDSDEAPERRYLSASDYKNLSEVERNQLALERYWDAQVRKNLWLVGIQYERYIGWLYEKDGYTVAYHGALNGKEDLGIDLVATKGAKTYIIQCKRYSEIKKIPVRENSVAQIYGAAKVYAYQNGLIDATPVIITSFELSETATLFAKALGVEVREHEALKQYPCIKCNINNSTGEKIYHLPFDQMYDHTVIEPDKGEFYAASVKEAYNAGFRRAYRWRGESTK